MSRLESIQRIENMIVYKDYGRRTHSQLASDLKLLTDEFIQATKPEPKPAPMCDRFIEMEKQYGLHKLYTK